MGRSGSFLTRTIATGLGLLVAISIVPGIKFTGSAGQFIVLALVFGVVNAVVRPILKFLSCPLVLLTLGLFVLIINALMLLITQSLAQTLGIAFAVDGFGSAIIGAIVVTIVSVIANSVIRD
ncbi:MAG: phage holin family protein [Chloroflexi bacterium]|nr:phage holin family protein [Chloroflexota bacterium]